MDTTNARHFSTPTDGSLAFDLAEQILDRLRAGQKVDLSAECRACPELLPQVRSLVEAAADLEGVRDRLQVGEGWAPGDLPPTGYEIVREIARGAMGVVYEARQLQLNRVVAFKMVLNADPSGLLRFLAEAEAIAAVRHPNVVQVYESGQHDGQPYLAMELCPGGTMAAKLKEGGRLAPPVAVELMAQVAAGVAAAHAEGIVHRDLKPGNVLFDAAGVPKVADFGLAKRGTGADLTHTMAVMGTPAYMSPEQARGETKFVGPTADVWALGVMLYECLTGKKPFDGANPMALLEQVKSGVVAGVRSTQRDVPRDVELIVQKCLAKEPAERYATAAELAADLTNWLAGKPITAKPAGAITRATKWVRRKPAVAAAYGFSSLAMLLAVVAFVVFSFWRDADEARGRVEEVNGELQSANGLLVVEKGQTDEARLQVQAANSKLQWALANEQLLHEQVRVERDKVADLEYASKVRVVHEEWRENNVVAARLLLDGTSADRRGFEYDYLRNLCQGTPATFRVGTTPVVSASFSKDGKRVVSVTADGSVEVRNLWENTAMRLARRPTEKLTAAEISPDGAWILTAGADGAVRLWNAKTGGLTKTLTRSRGGMRVATFHPDAARVVTVGMYESSVRVWDVRTGEELLALDGQGSPVKSITFGAGGSQAIAVAPLDKPQVRVWDLGTRKVVREVKVRIGLGRLTFDPAEETTVAAFSPDQRRLVTAGDDGTATVWDVETEKAVLVLQGHRGLVRTAAFSPDGLRIVTTSDDWTAKVWNAKTGDQVLALVGHAGRFNSAAFSPDGSRIVTAGVDGTTKIWDAATAADVLVLSKPERWVDPLPPGDPGRDLIKIEGPAVIRFGDDLKGRLWNTETGRELLVPGGRGRITGAEFSPDGSRVVTAADELRLCDARTGRVLLVIPSRVPGGLRSVAFNPRGTRILAVVDGIVQVWTADTGAPVCSLRQQPQDIVQASFGPDGSRIVTRGSGGSVRAWNAATGAEERILHVEEDQTPDVKAVEFRYVLLSRDGKRIVVAGRNGTVRVSDVQAETAHVVLKGKLGQVQSTAFSADGTRLVTVGDDGMVRVWDAATGDAVLPLNGHLGGIVTASFSPDGKRIVTAGNDRTARVWDVKTGNTLLVLRGHSAELTSASFSPEGRRIVTTSLDGTARVWNPLAPDFVRGALAVPPEVAPAPRPTGALRVPVPGPVAQAADAVEVAPPPRPEAVKVLVVDSRPRWDFKFLARHLARDRHVASWLILTEGDPQAISSGNADRRFLPAFPATPAALAEYRILVVGDVPADYFSRKQQEMVRDFIKAGGGLIHISGRGRGTLSWTGTPLGDVLPVELDAAAKEPEPESTPAGFRPLVTPDGAKSDFLRLLDAPQENERLWTELPELYWHAPVKKVRPASVVYLTHPTETTSDKTPVPLLASHAYGSGYVLFAGIEETWRWRYNAGDQYVGRFWSQAVRLVAPGKTVSAPVR